jgi:hypothetical protein
MCIQTLRSVLGPDVWHSGRVFKLYSGEDVGVGVGLGMIVDLTFDYVSTPLAPRANLFPMTFIKPISPTRSDFKTRRSHPLFGGRMASPSPAWDGGGDSWAHFARVGRRVIRARDRLPLR